MGMFKTISQKAWVKGLAACFDFQSQPKGTVPRCTNMVLTRRGAWKTCDGSKIFSAWNGAIQPPSAGLGPILEAFFYQPNASPSNYFLINKEFSRQINAPLSLASSDGGAGLLSAGTYQWVITELDGAGGETDASLSTTLVLAASHQANLTWTASQLGRGFNLYRTKANGSTFFLAATIVPVSTAAYTDNVPDSLLGTQQPPLANTTQITTMYLVPPVAYTFLADFIKNFPAVSYPGPVMGASPYGGVVGGVSPIPLIVQFANLMFLALGNGTSPYQSDGTIAGTVAITNTFTAVYPSWGATLAFAQGDTISQIVAGTNYVFTAVQGGITGATPPTWPATLNQTVADGAGTSAILWKNTGQVSSSPAPRGAAHAEVYAGSLWVANTNPVITTDQLDGPSAIRMSDANNLNSWNPLNAAQIAKDNGQQITAIKAFAVAAAGIPTTQQLAIFKDFSTFLINGVFGATDFSIQQAQTDMGCVAARSLQFVPGFGLMRLSHLGFAVFDGLNDRLNSEEIRPYLFGGQDDIQPIDWNNVWNCKGAQTANPPMYVCAVPIGLPVVSNFDGLNTGALGVTLPSGTYYARITRVNGSGVEDAISQEYGPFVVTAGSPGTTFGFAFGSIPAGYIGWRIYFGSAANSENQYIAVPASSSGGNVFVTAAGTAGLMPALARGALTRILCYDLVLKAWAGVIDLPFDINVLKQFRPPNVIPQTFMGGFSDGALRQWQGGDPRWDAGAENPVVQYSLTPSTIFAEGGSQRMYVRRIVIRGVGANPAFNVTTVLNGQAQAIVAAAIQALGANQFDARVEIQQTVENAGTVISGGGPIELDSQDFQVVPKAVGAPAVVFS